MPDVDAATLLNRTFIDPLAAMRKSIRQKGFDQMWKETIRSVNETASPSAYSGSMTGPGGMGIVRRLSAYRINPDNSFEEALIDEWRGQKFSEFATDWEAFHSDILSNSKSSVRPVVNENGTVVGHAGIFRGDEIFIYSSGGHFVPVTSLTLKQFARRSATMFADRRYSGKRLAFYTPYRPWVYAFVVVDPEGFIVDVIAEASNDGIELSTFDPIDIYFIVMAVVGAVRAGLTILGLVRGAGSIFARRLGTSAGRVVLALPEDPVVRRLLETAEDMYSKNPIRSQEVLSSARVFRHSITSDVKWASYGQIEKHGFLSFSTGINAVYGEGVYAWKAEAIGKGTYIDIEVPAGTGVELIQLPDDEFYRLVPPTGERLPIKILGTNLTAEQIAWGRKMAE